MAVDDRARLEAALAHLGVPWELFACDPALADTAQFCAAYGFSLEDSANTIVVVGKADPRRYAACIVLAPHRLDVNRAVRDRLGTRKASFAGADETVAEMVRLCWDGPQSARVTDVVTRPADMPERRGFYALGPL